MDFTNLDYLRQGNNRQQRAYFLLNEHAIFSSLHAFDPILVGTIPINIDIDSSDLDIIYCWTDKEEFIGALKLNFGTRADFKLFKKAIDNIESVVCTFGVEEFIIEIFGQNIPTMQQNGYRHMIVEHKILLKECEAFRKKIVELKKSGVKTEPAFGLLLGLDKPYEELLNYGESQT